MKTFRELQIKLQDDSVDALFRVIDDNLNENWTHKEFDFDADVLGVLDDTPKTSCYQYSGNESLPGAYLFLREKDANLLHVSNIIPIELGQMSYDEYNAILIDFYDNVLKPIEKQINVEIEITEPDIALDDILTSECSKSFKAFSRCANRYTGNSHPLDQKRWFTFIICLDRNNKKIDPDFVQKMLVDDGWPEDKAFELSLEFESAMSLLEFYHETEECHA